jgi:hypothetical protein
MQVRGRYFGITPTQMFHSVNIRTIGVSTFKILEGEEVVDESIYFKMLFLCVSTPAGNGGLRDTGSVSFKDDNVALGGLSKFPKFSLKVI